MTTTIQRKSSKPKILSEAIELAKARGLRAFSRADVGTAAGVALATVSFHFGTMEGLRRAVVEFAIDNEVMPILVDARADRNSGELYTRMSAELKEKVAAYIKR
jgi:AcrR family transcriptional regulator